MRKPEKQNLHFNLGFTFFFLLLCGFTEGTLNSQP